MSEYEPAILIKPNGELIRGQTTPCGQCIHFCVERFYPNKTKFPKSGICGFQTGFPTRNMNRDDIAGVFCPAWMGEHNISCITLKYQESVWVTQPCKCCGHQTGKPYVRAIIQYFNNETLNAGVYKEE